MNIFRKGTNFFVEVKTELGRVSWSTRDELIGATAVVIVITLITALFIGFLDLLLSKFLSVIFR